MKTPEMKVNKDKNGNLTYNINDLKAICQSYINYVDSDNYHEDNDFKHYIFETAIETFFDKDVWKFLNSK